MTDKDENEQVYEILRDQNFTFSTTRCKEFIFKIPNLSQFKKFEKNKFPNSDKGLYALILKNQIFYIGSTKMLRERLKAHKRFFNFDSYLFFGLKQLKWMYLFERILIIKYKPIYNKQRYFNSGMVR